MHHLTLMRTLTPLHVGTGQSVGAIDLPVARERTTTWPIVPGSSLKGVLRDAATDNFLRENNKTDSDEGLREAETTLSALFGRAGSGGDDTGNAGALAFSDLRLICMPVRSYNGTFAYVTCDLAIRRLNELAGLAQVTALNPNLFAVSAAEKARTKAGGVCRFNNGHVILEDLDLSAEDLDPAAADALAKLVEPLGVDAGEFAKRLVCVESTRFTFLANYATEVVTHVSLDFKTKSAKTGFLRQEEAVPSEAIFAGLATASFGPTGNRAAAQKDFQKLIGSRPILQFGGKATTGMGICRFAALGGGQ